MIPYIEKYTIEKQDRSVVAVNPHADLFSSAAYQPLSSEDMDSAHLARLLEALAKYAVQWACQY